MSDSPWTRIRPERPGFYWLRGGRWIKPTVIEIGANHDGELFARGCDAQLGGSWTELTAFRFDTFEYAGPIEQPPL